MPTRRHLLAAASATGAAAVAGCLDALGGEAAGADDGDDDTEPTPEGSEPDSGTDDADEEVTEDEPLTVRLGALSVQNNHDDEHRVQIAVDAGGDVRHLGTYDLEGGGASTRVDGDWTDETGAYRVHAKLDDGEILTEDVTEGISAETDCVRVLVQIDDDGSLAVWTGSNCAA